jgi:hypothetical protein
MCDIRSPQSDRLLIRVYSNKPWVAGVRAFTKVE